MENKHRKATDSPNVETLPHSLVKGAGRRPSFLGLQARVHQRIPDTASWEAQLLTRPASVLAIEADFLKGNKRSPKGNLPAGLAKGEDREHSFGLTNEHRKPKAILGVASPERVVLKKHSRPGAFGFGQTTEKQRNAWKDQPFFKEPCATYGWDSAKMFFWGSGCESKEKVGAE